MTETTDKPAQATVEPTPEQRRAMGAALSKLISAMVGDVVVLMSRSPSHKHYPLADIEWMVLPAVLSGQYYVAEALSQESGFRAPVGVIAWARVSEDLDRRLSEATTAPVRLRPDEWTSGSVIWLIHAVGAPDVIEGAMKELGKGPLNGHTIKSRVTGADMKPTIREIQLGLEASQ